MKVKDLKKLLKDASDEMDVLIPLDPTQFDGMFLRPCVEASGVSGLGVEEHSDETIDSFILVPCGFFEEKEGVPPELN